MARASLLGIIGLLGGCSSGHGTSGPAPGERCEQGNWLSTKMVAPPQAGISGSTPTGGGDGAAISLAADSTFFVNFSEMRAATASFKTGGQAAVLSVMFAGIGKGQWKADPSGTVSASFTDLTTARAMATITLGTTEPPIFDSTLQQIDDQMMLGNAHMGIFKVARCAGSAMTMTTDFPGGTLTIDAKRA